MAARDNDDEEEEGLVALIEHRTTEVKHLRGRVSYYQSQLDESERKLAETKCQLSRIRSRRSTLPYKKSTETEIKVKKEGPASLLQISKNRNVNLSDSEPEDCEIIKTNRKPPLVIPCVNPKIPLHQKIEEFCKVPAFRKIPKPEAAETQARGTKRKCVTEESEHKDLIKMVCGCSSTSKISCENSNHIPSQHNRKLRTLVLCPTNDEHFVTSALDGIVNLWQIQWKASHATRLSSINAASLKQRRWPEDIAWHPNGSSLISVYTADDGDSQIAILNLDKGQEVTFLEDKPHVKGIINNVMFMPWDDNCFITGGNDHAVVHWSEKQGESSWKSNVLHKSMHSSAVMGVAGMKHKQIVVSVGADKKIIGFDLQTYRLDFKHQIESKCMSVLPNPCDFNLFMVQTGTPQRQLRLFDMRLKGKEIHEFGWKQESSTSQSALINQSWSPDGLYLTSGSADPTIHIFDIRFNASEPSQSIKAHKKRVFKAAWHHSLPLLISISSDLNIGLHNIA